MDIDYKAVLEDLRRRRQQLDGAIAAIEQMLGQAPGSSADGGVTPSTGDMPGKIRSDTFFGMQTPDAVKKYLGIVKRPRTAADIAKALEEGGIMSQAKNFYANVSTVVRRLEDRGELVQMPDTKEWAMASWYPSRPKPSNGGKRGEQGVASEAEGDQQATVDNQQDDGEAGGSGDEGNLRAI